MARRKRHEEHENHERWLVSYADFITLLFAFFVVMYSISSVNEGKYRVLSETLESVFSQPTRSSDPIQIGEVSRGQGERVASPGKPEVPDFEIELPELPRERPPVSEQSLRTINDISQQLSNALADLITNEDVSIKQTEDWLEVEINSNFLFASGDARLAREAVPVIGQIADVLALVANPLQVEGFTDDQPINTPRFPSNWELSAARAASVVNLLDRFGIQPGRMSAIGYGEFKPIADNETELGRQKNRRVVLVILGSQESRRTLEVFDEQLNRSETESENSITPITDSLPPPVLVPSVTGEVSP
ncbi:MULTISPECIES: flagellar motor protein MotD [unclassified Methylophaga]|uniref:flagellar motor protein MotD n=2 Tax=Methylophaga TaxID=40222 RepID=UPI000C8EA580|nr:MULTISPECIES: flagellar motor protein MotD [unclassified Methylophaga]MBN46003.1 flagellar motor protein MotD [Methylophaga sp.]|tara:strand:- start:42232 stop:43146 length:915 start_codon:yes stop_codon:yes gene_type:complete